LLRPLACRAVILLAASVERHDRVISRCSSQRRMPVQTGSWRGREGRTYEQHQSNRQSNEGTLHHDLSPYRLKMFFTSHVESSFQMILLSPYGPSHLSTAFSPYA